MHRLFAGLMILGFVAAPAVAQPPGLLYSQELSPSGVQAVQQGLSRAGSYAGRVDGVWGPDSAVALERYQQAHQLQTTGGLNAATAAALHLDPNALLSDQTISQTAEPRGEQLTPHSVRDLQSRLRRLGYYRGSDDGVWGESTANAVRAFQQSHGLHPTGTLGETTMRTLGLDPNVMQYR